MSEFQEIENFLAALTDEQRDLLLKRALTAANEWILASSIGNVPSLNYGETLVRCASHLIEKPPACPYQPQSLMRVGLTLTEWEPSGELLEGDRDYKGKTLTEFCSNRHLKLKIKEVRQTEIDRLNGGQR